jgi:hypothetical protein
MSCTSAGVNVQRQYRRRSDLLYVGVLDEKKRSGNNIPERFEKCFMSKRRLLDESLSIELSILQDLTHKTRNSTVYILHLFHCESAGAHFILLFHDLIFLKCLYCFLSWGIYPYGSG